MCRIILVTVVCLAGFTACVSAQNIPPVSQSSWLSTITQNAITSLAPENSLFNPAPPGPALYFCNSCIFKVPYIVFVPHNYNPATPVPVVVFLHGAILARDSFQYAIPSIAQEPIFSIAEKYHVLVVFPFARQGFTWPTQASANDAVLTIIGQVRKDYHVNEKRIFLGGISMGGIATFWFIKHRPGMFAGFYTISARIGDNILKQDLEALKTKPLYSLNAEDDPVFSFQEASATFDKYREEFPLWHFSHVPTGGHRFIYDGATGRQQLEQLVGKLLQN